MLKCSCRKSGPLENGENSVDGIARRKIPFLTSSTREHSLVRARAIVVASVIHER